MKKTIFIITMLLSGWLSVDNSMATKSSIVILSNDGTCDFQVGELVEVYDPIEKNWFESKILRAESNRWFIHYSGYDSKWDTWASCDRIRRIGESKTTPSQSAVSNTNPGNQNSNNAGNNTPEMGSTAIPKICPTANITLNVGDPILIKQTDGDEKVKLNIVNLEFGNNITNFKFYAVENFSSVYYNWKDIELDPNFQYTPLPETATPSKNEVYNIGEQIETFWTANSQFGAYEIVTGIIVSKDGDNFYVFFENEDSKSSQYGWRFISDIRSIGSSKNILLVTQNGTPKENLVTCKNELNTCYAGGYSNNWDFLWYYRHDLKGFKRDISPESMAFRDAKLLQDMLNFYECMYQTRQKYPDVGYSGRTISDRYDVQYEFLKNYKQYIKTGFDKRINAILNNIVTQTRNGFYRYELMRTDGKKLLMQEMVQLVKNYEESYKLLGSTVIYPESDLNSAYDKALEKFMKEELETNDGLVNNGHSYSGKDSRVEQLCIADLTKKYPAAKILSSGCYNNEFLIELNSFGVPIYRTKTVLIIFQSALFRTTVEALYTLREEYIGNGKYGNPSFPRAGTLYYLK